MEKSKGYAPKKQKNAAKSFRKGHFSHQLQSQPIEK